MSTYQLEITIAAPVEVVFDLWTNLDRLGEWTGGVTKVTDRTGPMDRPGTRFKVWFGRMVSQTEVVDVDKPRFIKTRFGNRLLRGENNASFEAVGEGTRLTQEFRTEGAVSAIVARIFATGSWKGSFRGELKEFARLAEKEAREH